MTVTMVPRERWSSSAVSAVNLTSVDGVVTFPHFRGGTAPSLGSSILT